MSDQLSSASIATQASELSSTLNSLMLLVFLMGIYTIVYFGTLYIYLTRKASQRRLVITAITVIYLISALDFATEWWSVEWQFVENGATRETAFIAFFFPPQWFSLIDLFCTYFVLVFADGLLIWRCFHLWQESRRALILPISLWAAEICMALSTLIFNAVTDLSPVVPSPQQADIADGLGLAITSVSVVTTVMTTFLIAYRIHSVSKQNGHSVRTLKHIIDIVVQSSFFYSVSLLVYVIDGFFATKPGSELDANLIALDGYSSDFAVIAPGLASTVMVARVALLAPETTHISTGPRISGLQFQGHSTAATDFPTEEQSRILS